MSNLRRSLEVYARLVWRDVLGIVCLAVLIGGLQLVPMTRGLYRHIPMLLVGKMDGGGMELRGPVEYSYPYMEEILSTMAAALIVIIVPIFIFSIFQIALKSWWDFHTSVVGLLKALCIA